METFLLFLKESAKKSGGKNVHLEHLEDEIFNGGFSAFMNGLNSLQGVVKSLQSNDTSRYDVSVKWDGSPALVMGKDPVTGKFFVGTKSVFNVTPKVNFTNADIDQNHPHEGLNKKLKLALKYFKVLKIPTILQGDLIFDRETLSNETIDGRRFLTFQPNTIKYAVDPKSPLGMRILKAKIGIVFHTEYDGNSIETLRIKQFNPDISNLTKSPTVWFDNATYRVAKADGLFNASEIKDFNTRMNQLIRTGESLKSIMNAVSKNAGAVMEIKTYFNSIVRSGRTIGDVNELLVFATAKLEKNRTERKVKGHIKKPTPTLDFLKKNRNQINNLFLLHNSVAGLKTLVMTKLSTLTSEFGTFLKKGNKYVATPAEGFVAIDRLTNNAIKLVDRVEFSRANFTMAKSWKK